MTSLVSRLLFGVEQSNPIETPKEIIDDRYHYGSKHYLDYYDSSTLEDRVKEETAEFDRVREVRKTRVGDIANRRQEDIMTEHFAKVRRIHEMLAEVDSKENMALYSPDNMMHRKNLNFDEWKRRETSLLIKRREAAIEVDKLRPDLNRRSVRGWLSAKLAANSAVDINSSVSEPGNWPKRKHYYPVTDFSTLQHADQDCEEEHLLVQRIYDKRTDVRVFYTALFPTVTAILLSFRRTYTKIPALCAALIGGAGSDALSAHLRAGDFERDYQDFRMAKYCWFVKNRPGFTATAERGVKKASATKLYNSNSIHSKFG